MHEERARARAQDDKRSVTRRIRVRSRTRYLSGHRDPAASRVTANRCARKGRDLERVQRRGGEETIDRARWGCAEGRLRSLT